MFLWPCQISGMNEAPGAWRRSSCADGVEVDLAVADLQAFAIEPLGVTKMQMSRMRSELREPVFEVESEMVGGEPGVGDVDAHPQPMRSAERSRLLRKDEDVLMALTAEKPWKRSHGLRNQLDAVHVEFAEARGEDPITFRLLLAATAARPW